MGDALHMTIDSSGGLGCQRHLFSLPEDALYLNCAARSPMLREVEKVGHQAVSVKNEPWRIRDDGIADKVRTLFAKLVNAEPCDIALTPSTSYAISQAAHNVARSSRVRNGDAVVVLENQMSSNVYPWQRLCREVGAHLVAVPPPKASGEEQDALEQEIKKRKLGESEALPSGWDLALKACLHSEAAKGRRIAVVAVPHFLWTDGSGPVDLQRLRATMDEICTQQRAVLVVDATQSLGVVPIDVKRWGIDWLACSVHKWLFGPYGLSLVYVAEEWSSDPRCEPIVQDEHSRLGADGDIVLPFEASRPGYSEEFQSGAKKFDAGGRVNPILVPMVEAALQQVLAWQPGRIAATLASLTSHCAKGARELGLVVPASHAPHFLGISASDKDLGLELSRSYSMEDKGSAKAAAAVRWADNAAAHLKRAGIYVSSRAGALRVSPHVYNTKADIDTFLNELKAFRQAQT